MKAIDFPKLLIEETPDALIATAPDGKVLYWNPGAETTFGYTSEEAIGRSINDLIVPSDRLEEEQAIIGKDWYPYGIEQNRPSIEALLQYAHEHGLTPRRVKIEELFAPSTMRDIPLSDGQLV